MTEVADPATTEVPTDSVALPAGGQPLPKGNWAVLADWHDVIGGKAYKEIMGVIRAGESYGTSTVKMREKIVELLVTNWSLDAPLPATGAVTDEIKDGQLVAALMNLPEVTAVLDMINGRGIVPVLSRAARADQASPTTGSAE